MPPSIPALALHVQRARAVSRFITVRPSLAAHTRRSSTSSEVASSEGPESTEAPTETPTQASTEASTSLTGNPRGRNRGRLRQSDPLRILFCGSDHFSCASLQALYNLHKAQPKLIKSIDVLVRPGKPAGRGLRRIATGPLFALAEELGLAVHKRDTFTGWELPPPGHVQHHETGEVRKHPAAHENSHKQPFNLIVAVSFGLFVPPRILRPLTYGGLNVHPSMLPDLRGPAPLQHALLCGRAHAGVTLQMLHETDFDRGAVLSQTPWPGLPVPEDCDVRQLHDMLAAKGAELLADALDRRLHVPPHELKGWRPTEEDLAKGLLREAPKITKLDSTVDWACWVWGRDKTLYPDGWTAADLARRFRAVGIKLPGEGRTGLWTHAFTQTPPEEKRVIFEDVKAMECPETLREVVLSIAQIKSAGPAPWLTEQKRSHLLPKQVCSAVFTMIDHLGNKEAAEFRLPYMVDGTSVIIPIKVPYRVVDGNVSPAHEKGQSDAIKIERMTVEGMNSKMAADAMSVFKELNITVVDLSTLKYSMEIAAKRVE